MAQLFSSVRLGPLHLRSALVRSATNDYCGLPGGAVSPRQRALYARLAQTPIGLIITGNFFVREDGRLDPWQNSLARAEDTESLRGLCRTVHEQGGTLAVQLSHAGAKSKVSAAAREKYADVRRLTDAEREELAQCFVRAAVRARLAGADAVQVHCGHGYLLSATLAPGAGGTPEQRFALTQRILQGIRQTCGPEWPVLIKLNAQPDDGSAAVYLRLARAAGAVAAEISGEDFAAYPPSARGYYLTRALALHRAAGMPVIPVGGFRTAGEAQAALDAGAAMVAACRPFISEPELALLWQQGQASRCLSCNRCFTLYPQTGRHCVFHPAPAAADEK